MRELSRMISDELLNLLTCLVIQQMWRGRADLEDVGPLIWGGYSMDKWWTPKMDKWWTPTITFFICCQIPSQELHNHSTATGLITVGKMQSNFTILHETGDHMLPMIWTQNIWGTKGLQVSRDFKETTNFKGSVRPCLTKTMSKNIEELNKLALCHDIYFNQSEYLEFYWWWHHLL